MIYKQCYLLLLKNAMDNLIDTMSNLDINEGFTLSRLLYAKDEVEYMCLVSLLSRDNNQAIFWFHEHFYSGYESFKLIYNIYLLFYSWLNPQFEKYICKQEYTFENLVKLVTNLSNSKYSFEAFILYNVTLNSKTIIKTYKGRPPLFLQMVDSKYRLFLHSLYKKDWLNVCALLKIMQLDESLYNVIKLYYECVHKIEFNDDNGFRDYENNELSCHVLKYIIAIILLCETSEKDVNVKQKQIYKTVSYEQQNYIDHLSDYRNIKTDYILHHKREYGINPIIGLFNLNRYNIPDLWSTLTHHWIYYASKTPLWERILYDWDDNWSYDHVNKKINVKQSDEFDEAFCLYHDEQSKVIQNMCLTNINSVTIYDFCAYFNYSPSFEFNDCSNWVVF